MFEGWTNTRFFVAPDGSSRCLVAPTSNKISSSSRIESALDPVLTSIDRRRSLMFFKQHDSRGRFRRTVVDFSFKILTCPNFENRSLFSRVLVFHERFRAWLCLLSVYCVFSLSCISDGFCVIELVCIQTAYLKQRITNSVLHTVDHCSPVCIQNSR